MLGTKKLMSFAFYLPRQDGADVSYYGTLLMLAACAGLFLTIFLSGCSGGQAHAVDPSLARVAQDGAGTMEKRGRPTVARVVLDTDDRAGFRLGGRGQAH